MSDNNVIPINATDDIRYKILVTVEGEDVQYDIETIGLTFDSSSAEIMNVVAPMIEEAKGVNIRDTYKIQKMTNNNNIYIIPNSVAG